MARMRTLKPDACTSETLAGIPREVRWTFSILWTHCDDEGRALWNPKLVKAAIYPLDDDMTPEVVAGEIALLVSVGALCAYEVGGRLYLHVPSWDEHQHPNRKIPSKLPPCTLTDHSLLTHAQRSEDALRISPPIHGTPANTGLTEHAVSPHTQRSEDAVNPHGALTPVVVDVDVDVVGGVAPRKRGSRLPDEWTPGPDLVAAMRAEGIPDLLARRELPRFRDYWRAKSGREGAKLDWDATWRNWLRRASDERPSSSIPAKKAFPEW